MLFESQIHDFMMWLPWVRVRREQSALRAIMEQRRRVMSPEDVAGQSELIMAQLEQMSAFKEDSTVLLYHPIYNAADLCLLFSK